MIMHHFWTQNGPFPLRFFSLKNHSKNFMYLLALAIVQNVTKIAEVDPEL